MTLDQVKKDYGKDVRIIFKHMVIHPQTATFPSLACCAAQQQGKFFEMEDMVWDKGWTDESGSGRPRPTNLAKADMENFAEQLGLNMAKFKAAMDSEVCKNDLAKDREILSKVGARGTPAFFINGRFLSGAQPLDRFKAIIDEEIKKADEALKKGMKIENYYDSIVKKGKKSV